ncbi:hypothetical protein XAC4043 [Xanthomonas citri pv. citri str. 306]|uniref:Uncharacterized protein n=1 Tax=Xanthomonas axonopodis pv. citri (strain 306) TaxID=190486 RepID=A0AAI8EU45_XANAC|nr:hypothetical protein XAC4043 [Xanthomonas citri pv. citri str. 306]
MLVCTQAGLAGTLAMLWLVCAWSGKQVPSARATVITRGFIEKIPTGRCATVRGARGADNLPKVIVPAATVHFLAAHKESMQGDRRSDSCIKREKQKDWPPHGFGTAHLLSHAYYRGQLHAYRL